MQELKWVLSDSISPFLIILSVFFAITSSYITLRLVGKFSAAKPSEKARWILMASLVFGMGVFAMHFIGMLAFHSNYFVLYNPFLLLLSLAISVGFTAAAFYVLYMGKLSKAKIFSSGTLVGLGIVLSHFTAIWAMEEQTAIRFNSLYFVLSLLIAVIFSTIAIKLFVNIGKWSSSVGAKAASSVILGLAISLMHYTAMGAARIIPLQQASSGSDTASFILVGIVFLIVSGMLLAASFFVFLDYRALSAEKHLFSKLKESEARFRRLVELSPEPIMVHSEEKLIFVNKACLKMIQAEDEKEVLGKSVFEFIPEELHKAAKKRMNLLLKGAEIKPKEQQFITSSGSLIDVETAGMQIEFEGKPAIQMVIRDITTQKRIRKELEDSQQRYRSLFEHNPDGVYSKDLQGNLLRVNRSMENILGYSKAELLKMSFHSIIHPDFLELTNHKFAEALEGKSLNYEILAIHKKGATIPVNITNLPIYVDEKITGVYGIVKNISTEKKAVRLLEENEEKYRQLAFTDQLTGLPNRHWFYEKLAVMVGRAKKRNSSIAVLIVDFDDFKGVNDLLGHHGGDLFLKEVAWRLKSCLRPSDHVSRHGGDEFIMVLEGVGEDYINRLAQRILKSMEEPVHLMDYELNITVSIGISLQDRCACDEETLIREADFAMYSAKEKGKNNYQLFTEDLKDKVTRKFQVESALRKAIEKEEFQLVYQPQIDLQKREMVGLEALLRWNSPFGIVSPAEFIPIAEETGLILPIGEWVIDEACRQMKTWENEGLPRVKVSVNVSARQFKDPALSRKVKSILVKYQINPADFEIEITESVMMNIEESSKVIEEIKALGVKMAIDDFGAGYSSLNVIKNVEIDTLKIDKSLIDDVTSNHRNFSILTAIIGVGKSLQTDIVVEGIETAEQVGLLHDFHVIGQGFFFSRPCSPGQLETMWRKVEK
jgi:diguanylate cyclase (GGDEF)-like protein/PAS domain S-box-containing protein